MDFISALNFVKLQYWFPDEGVSWYMVESSLVNISFTDHDKFGMQEDATVWARYLLSFYWVAATLTCNG